MKDDSDQKCPHEEGGGDHEDENHLRGFYPVVTVILLCGLPASGKSTLARRLATHLSTTTTTFNAEGGKLENPPCYNVHLIEYDDIEEQEFLARTADGEHRTSDNSTSDDHKSDDAARDDDETDEIGFQRRQAWKRARQIAVERLQHIMEEREHAIVNGDETKTHAIVLMDDNFHLRGMRKQIHRRLLKYRNCRRHGINFGIICVDSPLEICLQRNRQRQERSSSVEEGEEQKLAPTSREVPDYTITKMNDIFEPPRVLWESNHIIVTTDDQISPSRNGKESNSSSNNNATTITFDDIVSFVVGCTPIIDIPHDDDDGDDDDNNDQRESARRTTRENQIYNLDQTLRTWVSCVARHDKRFARAANDGRKVLLEESRRRCSHVNGHGDDQGGRRLSTPCSSPSSSTFFTNLDDLKTRFVDLVVKGNSKEMLNDNKKMNGKTGKSEYDNENVIDLDSESVDDDHQSPQSLLRTIIYQILE